MFGVAVPGKVYVFRLPYGEDLLAAVKMAAETVKAEAGVFWIIGAVQKGEISFYNQSEKKYVRKSFDQPMEILSCIGNVSKLKGETLIHAHIALGDETGKAYGGHLEKGTIIFAAELFLLKLEGIQLTREYDDTTGLNLFSL